MSVSTKLVLCDLRLDVCDALSLAFAGTGNVVVKQKSIIRIRCDAFAAAGNSFGDMGGGVDKVLDDHSKGHYQQAVMGAIRGDWMGELPVGASVYVPAHKRLPGLIYAPTMRVPGRLPELCINAYLAMRAILIAQSKYEIRCLACPALCTGVGGLAIEDAAEQMLQAYQQIAGGRWESTRHALQAPYVMRD